MELANEKPGLVVYPNPVQSQVELSLEGEVGNLNLTFRLADRSGNILLAFKGSLTAINNQLNKRVKALKADIYTVQVSSNNKIYTSRFVKE